MGAFGTSQKDEENLRSVYQSEINDKSGISRGTSMSSATSAYDTADEGQADTDKTPQQDIIDSETQPQKEYLQEDIPLEDNVQEDIVPETNVPEANVPEDILEDLQPKQESATSSSSTATFNENEEFCNSNPLEIELGLYLEQQLDWNNPENKENPYNWLIARKVHVTVTTAFICLSVSLGSSIYIGGIPEIMEFTGASRELCLAGVSLYVLGLSFGPPIAAPISETFGRGIVYKVGFPISMLLTMGVGLSNTIYQILILRFFSGLVASPALAIAGASVTDVWVKEDTGFSFACFCAFCFLGPVLGPILGGFAGEHKGWRFTMWVSLIVSGAIFVPVMLLPETYRPVVLKRAAKKRGIKLPTQSKIEILKTALFVSSLRPLQMLAFDPIITAFALYVGFVFAVLFGFFDAFPIIFIETYGMDPAVSGLTFIAVGLGLILACVFYIYLDKKFFFPKNPDGTKGRRDENGNLIGAEPERLLFLGKIGGACLPISFFWLAWTSRASIHWICPTLAGLPFGFGLLLIFFAAMLYMSMSYPSTVVSSGYGANSFTRYLLASAFPLFTTQMYRNLNIHWATSTFGFISLALLPIPWLLERYGPLWRSKSRWGYASLNIEQNPTPIKEPLDVNDKV